MRKLFLCLIAAVLITGCITTGGGAANDSAAQFAGENQDFSDVMGKEWKLLAVHIDGIDTQFRRDNQPAGFSRDIFTVKFDDKVISGAGAPNRFSGRYTPGENQSLGVTPLASTQMASFLEPENLREHDFLSYVGNATAWSLTNNGSNLELTSVTSDGKPVKMVFGL